MNGEGDRFGRYELRGVLGHGGFAMVYRAFDPALGREVALKALLPELAVSPELRGRFMNEARSLARLQHPNIVRVFDIGEAEGRPFFAMELIEGTTLAGLAPAGRRLPLNEVVRVAASLASALDYIHAAGLVHRDIKAANVMVEPGGRVVLMDFGVARSLDQTRQTLTGASLGTPEAMAPEQVRGQPVGPAADIYALGILVYRLLAGRAPFVGDTAYVLHAQVYEPPPPLPSLRGDLPAAVYRAVQAALAKESGSRPRSAGEFARLLGGDPTVAVPAVPPAIPRNGSQSSMRVPLLIGAGVALALLAALAGGLALANRGGQPSTRAATAAAPQTAPPATPASAATPPPAATTAAAARSTPSAAATAAQPEPTVAPPTRTAAPTPSPRTATPPPAITVPPGDYRVVQNTDESKCLHARAAAGANQPINQCVDDGFVVLLTAGPVQADGYDWYNAYGLGWMASGPVDKPQQWLAPIPQPPPPNPLPPRTCLQLTFQIVKPGTEDPPPLIPPTPLRFDGATFASFDSSYLFGSVYGSKLSLAYDERTSGGRRAGTVSGTVASDGTISGTFTATAFTNGTGAYGTVHGTFLSCVD